MRRLRLAVLSCSIRPLSRHFDSWRVTVTRQLSKWRDSGLIEQDNGPIRRLRIAPELVEG